MGLGPRGLGFRVQRHISVGFPVLVLGLKGLGLRVQGYISVGFPVLFGRNPEKCKLAWVLPSYSRQAPRQQPCKMNDIRPKP